MSLEQFCIPSVDVKKPWMFFNGASVNTSNLIVGPLIYPSSLPVAKSVEIEKQKVDEVKVDELSNNPKNDNKKIVASAYPQYLVEDTGGGFLQFVEYLGPSSNSSLGLFYGYYANLPAATSSYAFLNPGPVNTSDVISIDSFQFQINNTGTYSLNVCGAFQAIFDTTTMNIQILQNGVAISPARSYFSGIIPTGTPTQFTFTNLLTVNSGDIFGLFLNNISTIGSSSTLNITDVVINIVKVG